MNISHKEIEDKLIEIAEKFLKEAGFKHRRVNLENSMQIHLGLGSLARMELLLIIEKVFGIKFSDRTLGEINTLRDAANTIFQRIPVEKDIYQTIPQHEDSRVKVENAKTLIDILLFYGEAEPDRKHVFFQDEHQETVVTYGKLLNNSLKIARSLFEKGAKPGDRIAMMLPNHPAFLYTFFGILLINGIPVPIYPLLRKEIFETFAQQEAIVLNNAKASFLVTFLKFELFDKLVLSLVPSLIGIHHVDDLMNSENKDVIVKPKESDYALIQYHSSRTPEVLGALSTHQNILSSIRSMGQLLSITQKDVFVNWTPLYRNHGLIGMWLGSLYYGIPLILMSPYTFLNRPERWLWAMHYANATISGGDDFAYDLCLSKIVPAQIEGLDLSSWRFSIHLAELVQARTLERFYKKFAPYGLKSESFLSIYGWIESSTCIAHSEPGKSPFIDRIQREPFENEGKAIKADIALESDFLELVSTRNVLPEHAVRIVDDSGNELPNNQEGNLQVKGPFNMKEYYNNKKAAAAIYHGGWWETGDLAYKEGENLYITTHCLDIKKTYRKFSAQKHQALKKLDRSLYESVFLENEFAAKPSGLLFQRVKNYAYFAAKAILFCLGKILKLIYSIYVLLLFIVSVPPVFISMWMIPKKIFTKILHYWAKWLFIFAFCPIKVYHKEELYKHKRIIFVANHASYIDTLVFMSILPPETKIVGKQELEKLPVVSTVMRRVGHIFVNRQEFPAGVKKSIETIERTANEYPVLIFPEGTFSPAPGLRPFKFGAFKIAAEKHLPVLPVATQGTRSVLKEGEFLIKPRIIKVYVGEPLLSQGHEWQEFNRLKEEARDFIAGHCGELSLDLIVAGKGAAMPFPEDI